MWRTRFLTTHLADSLMRANGVTDPRGTYTIKRINNIIYRPLSARYKRSTLWTRCYGFITLSTILCNTMSASFEYIKAQKVHILECLILSPNIDWASCALKKRSMDIVKHVMLSNQWSRIPEELLAKTPQAPCALHLYLNPAVLTLLFFREPSIHPSIHPSELMPTYVQRRTITLDPKCSQRFHTNCVFSLYIGQHETFIKFFLNYFVWMSRSISF
jgi:hypothetical protein